MYANKYCKICGGPFYAPESSNGKNYQWLTETKLCQKNTSDQEIILYIPIHQNCWQIVGEPKGTIISELPTNRTLDRYKGNSFFDFEMLNQEHLLWTIYDPLGELEHNLKNKQRIVNYFHQHANLDELILERLEQLDIADLIKIFNIDLVPIKRDIIYQIRYQLPTAKILSMLTPKPVNTKPVKTKTKKTPAKKKPKAPMFLAEPSETGDKIIKKDNKIFNPSSKRWIKDTSANRKKIMAL